MKYMIIRKADEQTEAEVMPTEALLKAMGDYNEEMIQAGVMLRGEGLKSSKYGFRVSFNQGTPVITDGPFTETKELLAGYTMIEVDSKEAALAWAKKWPTIDGEANAQLEVRQLFELSDFEPSDALDHIEEQFTRNEKRPQNGCPYLVFNGDCKAAFEYYEDVLGGTIEEMMTHRDSPVAEETAEEDLDKVLHARLNLGSLTLMGSDSPKEYYASPQGMHVQIVPASESEAERIYKALAAGGNVQVPLDKTFWAKRFAMLTDQFNIPWIINYE
ncbi:YciI family protein [Kangiella shandongensis]|uniref:YciI family protein n=1 Tax=Kangiella shandongensis TaxID=2763258 RepID=UPI001CBB1CA3|nr:YciI family protein [Kangiella shandongensis]